MLSHLRLGPMTGSGAVSQGGIQENSMESCGSATPKESAFSTPALDDVRRSGTAARDDPLEPVGHTRKKLVALARDLPGGAGADVLLESAEVRVDHL